MTQKKLGGRQNFCFRAAEAWSDGAAAFNDGESLYCLARRLCRASLGDFVSGRALLASSVMRWEEVGWKARGALAGIRGGSI